MHPSSHIYEVQMHLSCRAHQAIALEAHAPDGQPAHALHMHLMASLHTHCTCTHPSIKPHPPTQCAPDGLYQPVWVPVHPQQVPIEEDQRPAPSVKVGASDAAHALHAQHVGGTDDGALLLVCDTWRYMFGAKTARTFGQVICAGTMKMADVKTLHASCKACGASSPKPS